MPYEGECPPGKPSKLVPPDYEAVFWINTNGEPELYVEPGLSKERREEIRTLCNGVIKVHNAQAEIVGAAFRAYGQWRMSYLRAQEDPYGNTVVLEIRVM